MKRILSALLLFIVTAAAHGAAFYVGDYFGISYSNGNPVAGVNIHVDAEGKITGQGAYTDLTKIVISGSINGSNKVKIKENSAGHTLKYKATFDRGGQSFTANLSTGNVLKGTKVSTSFRQAGIYYAATDDNQDGIFILQNDHNFYGILYDSEDEVLSVEGTASASGFSGEDEDDVTFSGTFHGTSIAGTYSYEGETLGSFHGYKY